MSFIIQRSELLAIRSEFEDSIVRVDWSRVSRQTRRRTVRDLDDFLGDTGLVAVFDRQFEGPDWVLCELAEKCANVGLSCGCQFGAEGVRIVGELVECVLQREAIATTGVVDDTESDGASGIRAEVSEEACESDLLGKVSSVETQEHLTYPMIPDIQVSRTRGKTHSHAYLDFLQRPPDGGHGFKVEQLAISSSVFHGEVPTNFESGRNVQSGEKRKRE